MFLCIVKCVFLVVVKVYDFMFQVLSSFGRKKFLLFWYLVNRFKSLRGKLTRLLRQFTPHSWMDFDWKPTQSLGRWLGMLGVIGIVCI